ncbi:MAG: two-component regulator propeller domain-containing protein [Bacteroidota bacterium]
MLKSLLPLCGSILLLFLLSCSVKESGNPAEQRRTQLQSSQAPIPYLDNSSTTPAPNNPFPPVGDSTQISEYVRRIFQDSEGRLWFGSNGYGLCRYDGDTLVYFSIGEGLPGTQVTGMIEDRKGHLWTATDGGVSRYDGRRFSTVSFATSHGWSNYQAWCIFEDSEGTIWAGTAEGVHRYNGKHFTPFPLPSAAIYDPDINPKAKVIRCITEDRKGMLWFGIADGGICKYDRKAERNGASAFTHITAQNGLCGNHVVCILEDRKGNIWASSMFGGLSKYDGTSFTTFNSRNAIGNDEVWNIYEDRKGNIWISSEGYGVYCYNGKDFRNFSTEEGLMVRAVQTIFEDREGRFWVGGGGGLFRLDGESFVNVKKEGPWE